MKILIAAGGTGGHFYPGLAVARELLAANHQVQFLIKQGDYVLPLLQREKIPYVAIAAGGFQRSLSLKNILTVFKLARGFFQSFQILLKEKPDTLLVMGGYLSVPPAISAKILKIPIILHEQNALPGLANRLLSKLASRVAVSFSQNMGVFGSKAVLTGNPVRKEFFSLPTRIEALKKWGLDSEKSTLFIFGGSLGAHRLNQLFVEAFEKLLHHANQFQIIHVTGPSDVTWVRQRYEEMPFRYYVDSYCHDMPSAYAASDLVICRSGASTISELCVVKKPAILIPYPHSTADHQTANAKILSDLGAAQIHQQIDLEGGRLMEILDMIMKTPSQWQAWVHNYEKLAPSPSSAAKKIAQLLLA